MFKKVFLFIAISFLFTSSLYATKVSKEECALKGENFIFAGKECIEFRSFKGDTNEHIMVIVHGTWDEGTNTLGRYAPFAESMNLNTDLTTIAISLPGYSNSSTNHFTSLAHKGIKNLAAKKEYVLFLGELINALKDKFKAKKVTYIGHSAGAMMGATLIGLKPNLIQNIALVGGRYDIKKEEKGDLISMVDVIDNIDKNMKIVFIYGTADKISKPEVTTEFFKIAKNKGLNVKLIKVEAAEHIDLDMTDKSVEAIIEMIEEE